MPTVQDVTATAPITSTGGTTPNIAIAAATTSTDGSMSSADKTKLDGIAAGAAALSSATPQSLGTAAAGSGTAASKDDHVHAHGDLAGGSLHATASTSGAGFMSAAHYARVEGAFFDVVAEYQGADGANYFGEPNLSPAFDRAFKKLAAARGGTLYVRPRKAEVGGGVSAASNSTPIVVTTSSAHGLKSGQEVYVEGVGGNATANGAWAVSVLTSTTFALVGSSGSGAYTSGGSVSVSGYSLKEPLTFDQDAPYKLQRFRILGSAAGSVLRPDASAARDVKFLLGGSLGRDAIFENLVFAGTMQIGEGVAGATNATPIVVTTNAAHGLGDAQSVHIAGVVGNAAANGSFFAKVTSSTTFELYSNEALTTAVAGSGAYTSGGAVTVGADCTHLVQTTSDFALTLRDVRIHAVQAKGAEGLLNLGVAGVLRIEGQCVVSGCANSQTSSGAHITVAGGVYGSKFTGLRFVTEALGASTPDKSGLGPTWMIRFLGDGPSYQNQRVDIEQIVFAVSANQWGCIDVAPSTNLSLDSLVLRECLFINNVGLPIRVRDCRTVRIVDCECSKNQDVGGAYFFRTNGSTPNVERIVIEGGVIDNEFKIEAKKCRSFRAIGSRGGIFELDQIDDVVLDDVNAALMLLPEYASTSPGYAVTLTACGRASLRNVKTNKSSANFINKLSADASCGRVDVDGCEFYAVESLAKETTFVETVPYTTTNETETVASSFVPADGRIYAEETEITGRRTDTGTDFATFLARGAWRRNGSSLVATAGGPEVVYGEPGDANHCTSGATGWRGRLAANGSAVEALVTGQPSGTVVWSIRRRARQT